MWCELASCWLCCISCYHMSKMFIHWKSQFEVCRPPSQADTHGHPLYCYTAIVVIYISLEKWIIVIMCSITYHSYFVQLVIFQLFVSTYTCNTRLICAFFNWKTINIYCTIGKIIKVAYHFLYVTSSTCESLDYESVIVLLYMYLLRSAVWLQLQEIICWFDKQQ